MPPPSRSPTATPTQASVPAAATRIDMAGLVEYLHHTHGAVRRMLAIAGPPGAGKSTFAQTLLDAWQHTTGETASLLAMDGFHFDDRVLAQRGQRARKGAPHTFDVNGLAAMLARLRADDGREIAVPVFDRTLEIARAGAAIIPPEARLIVVEGNYLLLDDPTWAALRRHFDLTVMLNVPRPQLADRLHARWQALGLQQTAIEEKMAGNDLPNIDLVLAHSVAADFWIANG